MGKTKEKLNDGRIVTTYEFPTKPEKKTFSQLLYDPKTRQILGRTGQSWGRIVLFYLCFYLVLAALFTICMESLLSSLHHQFPKWQLDESIIGTNPGLGYRPIPDDPELGTIIHYTAANKSDVQLWVNRLDSFLASYKDHTLLTGGGKNQVICDFANPPSTGNVCAVDVSKLGACTSVEGYGYNKSSPCIFIKLNRIYGWVPDYYDNVDELPEDMPSDLVEHIKSLPVQERKQIWISCNAANIADVEKVGPIEYYPNRGLANYYYPFLNVDGYLSPLVAVHFARPAVKEPVNIECRTWAKNVIYRGGFRDRQGSIYFTLLID